MALPELAHLTHLGVGEGCGGTTLALQYAKEFLSEGGRVVWICQTPPDPTRFSQIFENVDISKMAKFHLIASGEEIFSGVQSASKLVRVLNPSLIVIDDWTPRTGRANKLTFSEISKMAKLIDGKSTKLISISALYGDASGENEWKIRGEAMLESEGFSHWLLIPTSGKLYQRDLKIGEQTSSFKLSESGFKEVGNQSSS